MTVTGMSPWRSDGPPATGAGTARSKALSGVVRPPRDRKLEWPGTVTVGRAGPGARHWHGRGRSLRLARAGHSRRHFYQVLIGVSRSRWARCASVTVTGTVTVFR